jgi:hypothetical protein
MNKQLADVALQFLRRVQLQGSEIEAFMAVKQALESVTDEVTEVPQVHEMEDK